MVGNTKPQSVADKKRLAAIGQIGCLPCMLEWRDGVPCTVQHVTDGGRRLKDEHQQTYGSCVWHHLGDTQNQLDGNIARCTEAWGPSLLYDKRQFEERYGTEEVLIDIQNVLIEAHHAASSAGNYITAAEFGDMTRRLFRLRSTDFVVSG